MRIILMAWRNIFRQKRRTLITLSALIIGLVGLVVFQGYIAQLMNGFRDSTIRAGIGHLQIAGADRYFEDGEYNPYAYAMRDTDERIATLAKDPAVNAVFPSTGFTSIAGIGDKSATLLVKAYPAERMYFAPASGTGQPPEDRFALGTLVAGSPPGIADRDRIVLGETAARILGVSTGDVITLMAVLPEGGLAGRDFTIGAIYRSPGMDKIFAYTDYQTARDFTSIVGAPVIHVLLKDIGSVKAVAARLPPGTAYRTWQALASYYVQVNTMFSGFQNVIRVIILLITLFILANTMNRIVFERMREWGTLRAMGTKKNQILLLVVLEGCFQGLVGAVIGIGLGFAVSALFNLGGGIPFPTDGRTIMVRVVPDARAVWLNLIPVVITAGAAAILPGLRAVKLTPSECLRQI
jgi:putative ABC transport system permease protein